MYLQQLKKGLAYQLALKLFTMKNLILSLFLLISGVASAQYTYIISADSTKLRRVGGNNELILENGTRATTGVLVNYGNGRTRFSKPRINGDTLFVGVDTVLGVGAAGTGWLTTGNVGTVDGTNFWGTIDDVPLNIRVNNIGAGRITSSGNQTYYGYEAGNGQNSLFTTAVGYQALLVNTGNYNQAFGYRSLRSSTTGGSNTAIGFRTLELNTTGQTNTAVGHDAMALNESGSQNVAVGYDANWQNISGSYNTAIGRQSLGNNLSDSNTSVGWNSASTITTGKLNTSVGTNTGNGITTGSYNTILGGSVTGLTSSLSNTIILADGQGNQRLRFNNSGALSFDAGSTFGSAGEVLTSNGSGSAPSWQAGGGGSGVTTLAAIGASPNANGATISGSTLNLEPASASFGGVVTTGTQTLAGAKTLTGAFRASSGSIALGDGTPSIYVGGIHTVEIGATGSNTPLTLIGGSGTVEMWKNSTPTHAAMIGLGTNGVPSNEFQISGYAGSSWNIWMQITSATGALKLNAYTAGTLTTDGSGNVTASPLPLTGTATLNFDLTAVNSQDLTITVTGAASGDPVSLALDPASVPADITYFGWVSSANTVTVRCSRVGGGSAVDPASGSFTARVFK